MQEISERLTLEVVQHGVIGSIARVGGSLVVRHFGFGIGANSYPHEPNPIMSLTGSGQAFNVGEMIFSHTGEVVYPTPLRRRIRI